MIEWVNVNDRWLPVDTDTGQVLSAMQADAEQRRIAGMANAFPTVRNAVAGPWLNQDRSRAELDTAGHPVWDIAEEWQGCEVQSKLMPLRGTDYEYRDGVWFEVYDGERACHKRVYTWNERNAAVDLYESGVSSSIVGEKFNAPAATIRTWAYRRAHLDDAVWFRPRFDLP